MRYFIIISVLLLQSCLGYTQSFEGTWRGELNVQGVSLPIIFHIENTSEWKGTMMSPAQGNTKFPLSTIHVHADSVVMEVSQIGLRYSGKFIEERLIEGELSQHGTKFPMQLRASSTSIKRPKRPQLPVPPYSYDTVEVTFESKFDDTRLSGTITIPPYGHKLPAVVLVSGSGPQDRDETMMGHKPFKVMADYLTKQGIVVLRYDERGIGKSTGEYPKSTIGDFSRDVISAVSFLQQQRRVNPEQVGIIGHSEGALIAELIAGESSADIGFIGLLGAPAIPIDSLMVMQAYAIGKLMGMSAQELQQAKEVNRWNFATVKSDLSNEYAYRQILENMSRQFPDLSERQKEEVKMMVIPAYRYFMRIDPIPFIQRIHVPVFAAFGTKDVQVPFAPNMESLTDHLPKHEDNVLRVYDGLNHLFQRAKTGAVSEYAEIEETFNEQVLFDLAEWINERGMKRDGKR